MIYQLIVEHRASKEIESLPNHIIQSVFESIEELRTNPRPVHVKKLIGHDGWRTRVGDYRILYIIDDKKKSVTIYRVKHRKDVYR